MLTGFVGLLIGGVRFFPPKQSTTSFIAYVIALIVVLFSICYLKGEPPRWRWGGK